MKDLFKTTTEAETTFSFDEAIRDTSPERHESATELTRIAHCPIASTAASAISVMPT